MHFIFNREQDDQGGRKKDEHTIRSHKYFSTTLETVGTRPNGRDRLADK